MTTIYGINSCDTVKKARRWLDAHNIDYRYHDLRGDGVTRDLLQRWSAQVTWEGLLNRRSTTWRGVSPAEKGELNEENAVALMQVQPTLIKRPILEHDGSLLVGFNPEEYAALLQVEEA